MQYLHHNVYGKPTIYWGIAGKIRGQRYIFTHYLHIDIRENIGADKGQRIEFPGLSLGKSHVLGARTERKKLEKDKVSR